MDSDDTIEVSDYESDTPVRNPCEDELNQMLPEVAETIRQNAYNSLRLLLFPKLLAFCRRRQRARASAGALPHATRVTTAQLRKLYDGLASWSDAALAALTDKLHYELVDRSTFVVHAGEPPVCGAFLIVSGTAVTLNPWTGARKTVTAPYAVGMNALLDGAAHPLTVRTLSRCDVWQLTEQDFQDVFRALPRPAIEDTIRSAFRTKNAALAQELPMTPSVMKRSRIFSACPESVLQELVRFATPYCVPRNHVLCLRGAPAERIVFPMRGKCLVEHSDGNAKPLEDAIFGDDAVLTGGDYVATLTTASQCDCYLLEKHLFDSAIRVIVEVPDALHAAFRRQRELQLDSQREAWSALMERFDVLRGLVDVHLVRELRELFSARVHRGVAVMCTTAQYADKVFLVLNGRVRLGDSVELPPGRFFGWTGIVQHRWPLPVVALDLVETIEMPLAAFAAFLKRHNVFDQVKLRALHLMFPKAFSTEANTIPPDALPALYPVSRERNLNRAHAEFVRAGTQHSRAGPKHGSMSTTRKRAAGGDFDDMVRVSSGMWLRTMPK